MTQRISKLIAVCLVAFVELALFVPVFSSEIVSYTSQQVQASSWIVISDGSHDLIDQNGKMVGDLGQPYADVASFSYMYNGSFFFRFSLYGNIPSSVASNHVTGVWYQVLLDTDLNPSTGYSYSSDFTPDYVLMFHVVFNMTSNMVEVDSSLWKYSGTGTDWAWVQVGEEPVLAGGVGRDFVLLTCIYQDLSVSTGSTIQLLARSGLRYDGQVYNDPVPDQGTIKITL